MTEQEKKEALISGFRKLDEGRKDYIRELTRKLADIHCGGGFLAECKGKNCKHEAVLQGINPA